MKANIIDVYFNSQGISILRRIDRQQFLYKKQYVSFENCY